MHSPVVLWEYKLVSTQIESSRANACTLAFKSTRSVQALPVMVRCFLRTFKCQHLLRLIEFCYLSVQIMHLKITNVFLNRMMLNNMPTAVSVW